MTPGSPGHAIETSGTACAPVPALRDPDRQIAIKTRLKSETAAIERRLSELIVPGIVVTDRLRLCAEYALLAPGKRVRPLLCLLAADAIGNGNEAALDAACAIEMIHTASLILDDLPSMDDAQLRRGRQAAHRRFGEATAILSAIALLAQAFGVLAEVETLPGRRNALVSLLSTTIGFSGLSAGQLMDLLPNDGGCDARRVEQLHHLKTGVLLSASLKCGALIAGGTAETMELFAQVGHSLGLAFQLADDLADATASVDDIGKDVRQDDGKQTIIALHGMAAARTRLRHRKVHTKQLLGQIDGDTEPLCVLIDLIFESALR